MPDSDYHPDEESEELAHKLAERTIQDIRGARSVSNERETSALSLERHAAELGVDAPMGDVTFVMKEFEWQWGFASEAGDRMPCLRFGEGEPVEIVPLSLPFDLPFLRPFRSWRRLRRFYPFPPDYLYEAHREFLKSVDAAEEVSIESTDNVLKNIQAGLGNFLAYRIAGFRAWFTWMVGNNQNRPGSDAGSLSKKPRGGGRKGSSGSASPPPPASMSPGGGLAVEFWCNNPGLTIEFSHAYFIHFLNFGAPSFPVRNTLLGGRYVFQGKGPIYPSGTPRSQVFRIPPDYKATTTLF